MDLTGIGMGTWNIGEDPKKKKDEIAALRYGLDNGIRIIDTAEMYGEGKSEKLIGEAIKGYDRSQMYIISKFYPYHATPDLERKSLEETLTRLNTDYLDLYLLHWRGSHRLSDTVRGLEELKKEGLIRHWGVSNFDTSDMQELFSVPNGEKCYANEDLYNLDHRGVEYDLLPWQKKNRVNFIGYIQVKVTQFELLIILKQLLVLMAQRRIKSCLRGRLEVETFYQFQKRAKSRI